MKRTWTAVAVIALAACGGGDGPSKPAPVNSVSVSLGASTIYVGQQTQASATMYDASQNQLSGRTARFRSDDAGVATVDSVSGVVTAQAAGTAHIIASSEGIDGQATLTVNPTVQVRLDSVSPGVLKMGSTGTLYGANFDANASGDVITVGGTRATVTSASATQISFTVPDLGCVPAERRVVQLNSSGTTAQLASVPVAPKATPLSLGVGGVAVLTGSSAVGCVELAATVSPSEYLFVPANADATPDVIDTMQVSWQTGDASPLGGGGYDVVAPPSRSALMSSAAAAMGRVDDAFEARLRRYARTTLRPAVARAAFARGALSPQARMSISGSGIAVPTTVSRALSVGDTLRFKVPGATSMCSNFDTVKATVKAIGSSNIIVQDVNAPANGFTATDFTSMAQEFDTYIYPTDTTYFGTPSDIDSNGKVYILFTPEVNKLTPKGSTSYVGGYFWAGDLYPSTGQYACPQSNEAEIFYMLVPDPTGIYSSAHATAQVRQVSRGTLGHEFQHMINAGTRLFVSNAQSFESSWLDEALAHFAEDVVGRAEDGFSQTADLTLAQADANNNDFNAFYYQNLARLQDWLLRPDTSTATSSRAEQNLAYRGAAWALLRYTADQYAGGNIPSFTRRLVAGPDTSTGNLSSKAGVPFDSLMTGWLLAMYADDNSASTLSRYQFTSWNMHDVEAGLNGGTYPLLVGTLSTGSSSTSLQLRSATGVYYHVVNPATGPSAVFGLTAPGGGALSAAGARLYIIRLN